MATRSIIRIYSAPGCETDDFCKATVDDNGIAEVWFSDTDFVLLSPGEFEIVRVLFVYEHPLTHPQKFELEDVAPFGQDSRATDE